MQIFVYDTETTGLPLWKEPSEDPRQPHLVQIAGIVWDLNAGCAVAEMSRIIKPDGWVSEPEALAAHKITYERAMAEGIPEKEAVEEFIALWNGTSFRVGHNESFDARILRIQLKRYFGEDSSETWSKAPAKCTARLSTPIVKLPPTERMKATNFRDSFKTPNMQEAYRFFFGRDFEGAHGAPADAKACLEVYLAILRHGGGATAANPATNATKPKAPPAVAAPTPPSSALDDTINSI